MKKVSAAIFWQTTLALTFLVTLAVLVASILRWAELGVILYRSVWAIPLTAYLAVLAGCTVLGVRIRKSAPEKVENFLALENARGVFWRIAAGAVFAGIVFLIPWLKFTFRIGEVVKKSTQDPLLTTILFYWVAWWLILAAAGALKISLQASWAGAFAAALVILGIAYEVYIRSLAVTPNLFSMGWSETSRYYYASLYFSKMIYGEYFSLSTMHPSRYLLQALAFLVPQGGLVWHRLWQFLLWVLTSAVTCLALVKRVRGGQRGEGLLFGGWFFLFILLVGVYYHLQVMVILVLLGVSFKRPWQSLVWLVLASAWAGISRINWLPVPAMLVIALYFLEQPLSSTEGVENRGKKNQGNPSQAILRYLKWPFVWAAAGLLAAFLAQAAYIPLSGNSSNTQAFTSSFTSDLLWNRLWPNDSYSLGIIPAILIVSGPPALAIFYAVRGRCARLHWIRQTGLFSMLVLLLGGGLVVSTKIGGGADLHNMDAYAILIGILAAYFWSGRAKGETETHAWGATAWPVQACALLIPLIFLIPALAPRAKYNLSADEVALTQLKQVVEEAAQNGPILFINERHLVTFEEINVPLVPDYENVTLMEMAMSGNRPYLDRFHTDLKTHRFAAIVAGKQNTGIMETGSFAEENNVWNTRVSPQILCDYEPLVQIEANDSRVFVYFPRAVPACP